MPNSCAICRMGLSFPAWAISISEGTGRTSFNLVGAKGKMTFLPFEDMDAPPLTGAFFSIVFFFGESFLLLDLVAIFSPFWRVQGSLSRLLERLCSWNLSLKFTYTERTDVRHSAIIEKIQVFGN